MDSTLDWLLDSDPAIRWQAMRDLIGSSTDEVTTERSKVAIDGWGSRVLGLQSEDGQWGDGAYTPKWISTTYTMLLLRYLGIDPNDPKVRAATDRVRDRVRMGRADHPFFEYVDETCIAGMALALSAYFRAGENTRVDWLLAEQLEDGGWNCATYNGSKRSSFNTTITALEALLEYERSVGGDRAIAEARQRAHEYLLERRLMYRLSTGDLINKRWLVMSFPPRWHYDVLRALDYLADAGVDPDERSEEAVEIIRSKKRKDGTWPLQNPHHGKEHFPMEEGAGKPSRWNTLRALRVLRWHESG